MQSLKKKLIYLVIICVISSLYINLKPSYEIKVETIHDISLFDSDKEYFVYFGRPSCPNCIKFQRYINNNDYRLPKKFIILILTTGEKVVPQIKYARNLMLKKFLR